MGQSGTAVAIEASGVILLEDRLSALLTAVKEGRLVWENLRKAVLYLSATALAEGLVVLFGAIFGLPLALSALQVLWANFVCDGITAVSLAYEPAEDNLMTKSPRRLSRPLVTPLLFVQMIWVSLLMAAIVLGLFHWYLASNSLAYARTVALTTTVFLQIAYLAVIRSRSPLLAKTRSRNPIWRLSALWALLLQLSLITVGPLTHYFGLEPLRAQTLLVCLGGAVLLLLIEELRRRFRHLPSAYARHQERWGET